MNPSFLLFFYHFSHFPPFAREKGNGIRHRGLECCECFSLHAQEIMPSCFEIHTVTLPYPASSPPDVCPDGVGWKYNPGNRGVNTNTRVRSTAQIVLPGSCLPKSVQNKYGYLGNVHFAWKMASKQALSQSERVCCFVVLLSHYWAS